MSKNLTKKFFQKVKLSEDQSSYFASIKSQPICKDYISKSNLLTDIKLIEYKNSQKDSNINLKEYITYF